MCVYYVKIKVFFLLQTVQVVHEDQDEKIVCRVNDCDATSQVKAKILDAVYKNTPFSLRPSINDVDLGMKKILLLLLSL